MHYWVHTSLYGFLFAVVPVGAVCLSTLATLIYSLSLLRINSHATNASFPICEHEGEHIRVELGEQCCLFIRIRHLVCCKIMFCTFKIGICLLRQLGYLIWELFKMQMVLAITQKSYYLALSDGGICWSMYIGAVCPLLQGCDRTISTVLKAEVWDYKIWS